MSYIQETNIFELLSEEGIETTINTIIKGGSDLEDTFSATIGLLDYFNTTKLRIWYNEYDQPANKGKTHISKDKKLLAYENISSEIILPRLNPDTVLADVNEMLIRRQTYDEYIASAPLMSKSRIKKLKNNLYARLSEANI